MIKSNASKYLLLFLLIVVIAGLLLAGLALGQDTATNKATTSIKSDSVEQQRLDLEQEKLEFERERLDRELKSKDDDRELAMNQFMEEKRKTTALIVGAFGAFATIIITLLTFLANQQAKERERFNAAVQSITSLEEHIDDSRRLASVNSLQYFYKARSWMHLRAWGWPFREEIVNLVAACFKQRGINTRWRHVKLGLEADTEERSLKEPQQDKVFYEALASVIRDIAPIRDGNVLRRVFLPYVDFFKGYSFHNPFSNVDMTLADLNDLYLKSTNLEGINLALANLRRTDLTVSNLSKAILSGANFENSIAFGANFRGANLRWAVLRGADVTRAYYSEETRLPPDGLTWTPKTDMSIFTNPPDNSKAEKAEPEENELKSLLLDEKVTPKREEKGHWLSITWLELGNPVHEGPVLRQTHGRQIMIYVTKEDIERAAQYGNKVIFRLIDVSAVKDEIPVYRLGMIKVL